jgi:hypothetical protein
MHCPEPFTASHLDPALISRLKLVYAHHDPLHSMTASLRRLFYLGVSSASGWEMDDDGHSVAVSKKGNLVTAARAAVVKALKGTTVGKNKALDDL